MNSKYIIVELIPEALSPEKGNLVQLSALKIDDLKLVDRFDYRINKDKITNPYVLEMVKYDDEAFNYLESTKEILDKFSEWIEDNNLLIINNEYTNNYLKDIVNKKIAISSLLNIEEDDEFINNVINKYNLEPSNYIVDLLYEALIYESNNK